MSYLQILLDKLRHFFVQVNPVFGRVDTVLLPGINHQVKILIRIDEFVYHLHGILKMDIIIRRAVHQ